MDFQVSLACEQESWWRQCKGALIPLQSESADPSSHYSLSAISRELIMCVPKGFSQRQISHFIINLLP